MWAFWHLGLNKVKAAVRGSPKNVFVWSLLIINTFIAFPYLLKIMISKCYIRWRLESRLSSSNSSRCLFKGLSISASCGGQTQSAPNVIIGWFSALDQLDCMAAFRSASYSQAIGAGPLFLLALIIRYRDPGQNIPPNAAQVPFSYWRLDFLWWKPDQCYQRKNAHLC